MQYLTVPKEGNFREYGLLFLRWLQISSVALNYLKSPEYWAEGFKEAGLTDLTIMGTKTKKAKKST